MLPVTVTCQDGPGRGTENHGDHVAEVVRSPGRRKLAAVSVG